MRAKGTENYYTLGEIAQQLGIANNTIKRWYQWYESGTCENDLVLPDYHYLDRRGTKYFEKCDLDTFKDFQTAINTTHRGIMSQFNKKFRPKKEG